MVLGAAVGLDPRRPFRYTDLEAVEGLFPDGFRLELMDGSLLVSPVPNTRHRSIMAILGAILLAHKPDRMIVLPDANLLIDPLTMLRPDLMVADVDDVGEQAVVGTPKLVMEIHSPSTRRWDLTTKRSTYEAKGIPAYWLVGPEVNTLTVLELEGGTYTTRTVIGTGDEHTVSIPFPVQLRGSQVFGS